MGKKKPVTKVMEVVENKNAPGNGLTDSVSPEDIEPLKSPQKNSTTIGDKLRGVFKSNRGSGGDDKSGSRSKSEQYKLNSNAAPVDGVTSGELGPDDLDDPGPSVSDTESDPGKRDGGVVGNNRRKNNFLQRLADGSGLRSKRAVIYLLFCLCLIFILFFMLILLAALWPGENDLSPCQTAKCHLFSSQFLEGINSSTKPCDNFWEYSCGGWLKVNPLPKSRGYWDTRDSEELKIKEKLRTVLNTLPIQINSANQPSDVVLKMKSFYDSCMSLQYIEAEQERPLQRVIKALGGWNVLRDFRANDFDFPRILRKLHAQYRVSAFFKVEVEPDPKSPSRNMIKISPSGLSLPDRSYYFEGENTMAKSFQAYAKDVVQILGAPSFQGSQFAIEIFNFEKRIAEVTPDSRNLSDPVASFKKITVAELKTMSNTIFWVDLLRAVFPQGNINDGVEVLTPSVQYLMDISSIISTTDKGNLNNYMMWHLTQKFLQYLNRPFISAQDMLLKDTIGSTETTPRWEYCMSESVKYFPHISQYILSQNMPNRAERVRKIDDMFEAMRQTLMNRVTESSKFDESMKHFLRDKLQLMTIQIGTPVQNASDLQEMYYSVAIQKGEFFVNIEQLTEFQANIERRELNNPNKNTPILHAFSKSLFNIQFLPSYNKIVVPESILYREILSLPETHLPLIFGSVSVELAQAMAMAFGPEQGLYFSDGGLMSVNNPKAEELREIIESRRSCLASFFTKIRLDDEPYIEQTSLDTTMHLAGIQIALDTLKTHDASEKFESLPGFEEFSSEAMFFLAYGQTQCSTHSLLYHDLEHNTFTSLSHDHRVRGVLRQMVTFSEAFQCHSSTEMFADFTCNYVI